MEKNVIKEAVFAKRRIYKLYIDQQFSDHRFLQFLKDKEVEITRLSKKRTK